MTSVQAISVVIPVFNEEDNVTPLLEKTSAALSKMNIPFEIVFVDDGSTDETLTRLKALKQIHPQLKVIGHKSNYGQSVALCTGVQAASYPLIATLDGDGQNDPNDIAALCALYKPQTVVLGNRQKRRDTPMRRLASRIGNGMRNAVLKDSCPDTGCSLKLFEKAAFLKLPAFNHMHRFLPTLFMRAGYEMLNVPVNHLPREHGTSKYGNVGRLFAGIYDLMGVYWLLKRSSFAEVKYESR